jgi:hypothetical protein
MRTAAAWAAIVCGSARSSEVPIVVVIPKPFVFALDRRQPAWRRA